MQKPTGFQYLSLLEPLTTKCPLKMRYLNYINDEYSTQDKINAYKNPFSLSGSKAKQLVLDPYSRYQEIIMNKEVVFSKESQIRMKMGKILEDTVVYHLIKPEYENNPLWADKVLVIDKRRRQVEGMPWISYEIDLLVYQLEKPRSEYDFYATEFNTISSAEFVINNTTGAYDEFLAQQTKYAVYDIKVSQLDVLENYTNYIYQLQAYAYFEKVLKCGLFNLYKNSKLEELIKNYDANIVNKIFYSYDNFIDNLENNNIFEKEKLLSTCTELPSLGNDLEQNNIINKIYNAINLYHKYGLKEKEAKLNIDTLKEFIKAQLPLVTNADKFNITIPLTNTDKLSFYTTKKISTETVNLKELLLFLNNNMIEKVVSSNGVILDFNLDDFTEKKVTGGTSMFRLTTKTKPTLDDNLQEFSLYDHYNL